jgi:hypothetical protein
MTHRKQRSRGSYPTSLHLIKRAQTILAVNSLIAPRCNVDVVKGIPAFEYTAYVVAGVLFATQNVT